jgi:hypothetical protein
MSDENNGIIYSNLSSKPCACGVPASGIMDEAGAQSACDYYKANPNCGGVLYTTVSCNSYPCTVDCGYPWVLEVCFN